ncbi:hypothetical protein ACA910_016636 [Epithemia clementina (nom. ined.)]
MSDGVNASSSSSSSSSIRPLSCELSILNDANGSAVWKSGGTMVMASCHGPTAPRQAQTLVSTVDDNNNYSGIPGNHNNNVLVQVLLPGSLRHSSEWEVFLTNVLSGCVRSEACPPDSIIQIVLQIQSDDGSVLAACVHASVSALMDASIEINYLPVAINCVIFAGKKKHSLVLDPTLAQEEQDDAGLLTLVVVHLAGEGGRNRKNDSSSSSSKMGGLWTSGIRAGPEQILQCWKIAKDASAAVTTFWRMALNHKHQHHAKTLFSG